MLGKVKALAAGFVLGLFIAPRSGRESRRLIVEWFNDFFEDGQRRLRDLEGDLARRRDRADDSDWSAESLAEDESLP